MPDLGEITRHPLLCLFVIFLAMCGLACWIVLAEEKEQEGLDEFVDEVLEREEDRR